MISKGNKKIIELKDKKTMVGGVQRRKKHGNRKRKNCDKTNGNNKERV